MPLGEQIMDDNLEQANVLVEEDKIRAYTRKYQILGNVGLKKSTIIIIIIFQTDAVRK